VCDKTMDLIQMLLDHKVAGSERVLRSNGRAANRSLDGRESSAKALSRARRASSAGRSAGDRGGQTASRTRPGSEINNGTISQLAGVGLTR
jgi:hypothetical protein